ncbi:MAG: transcriptional regulator [Syntrophobacteraceae bacterium CG07_land_8_20_14_0_80_61_8]|nr:MAG: transcriptional regulator [Syntrophobacteraceae bacterium CG07_land_8_20_14_0_80_61_8]
METRDLRIRLILMVLSILAFLSAATGGFLYYSSLRRAAVEDGDRQARERLSMFRKNLSVFLSENIPTVKTLAAMKDLRQALLQPDGASLGQADAVLDLFKRELEVDVCYLMDRVGTTMASSNRGDPDSFVGRNFDFRPYFQQAIEGSPSTFLGLGTTTNRRGAYYSHPVYGPDGSAPLGVAVIKKSIELIEQELTTSEDEIAVVIDPHGIVFVSSRKDWLFRSLTELSPADASRIASSHQFGKGPWKWTGLRLNGGEAEDESGRKYAVQRREIDHYPGWEVVYLRGPRAVAKMITDPLVQTAGHIILVFCLLVALSVFLLYRKASKEITQRKAAEMALRKSEERYRSIFHSAPAMLHSIDTEGRVVMVSDHWLETLGYAREEVVGRKVTDFFSEASRAYAEEKILPEFFETGCARDICHELLGKNGGPMLVLLSAIGMRDEKGKIIGSLTVSIDVTEQKRAEAALKNAQEELGRYARDLERQVRKRTREIAGIFQYTPAVVFLKDLEGHYLLVNPRFEALFGIGREEVKGKNDHDLFPQGIADQLRANDMRVLAEERSVQVEERIFHMGRTCTYISVKFPIYDELGVVSGRCGISTDITAIKAVQEQLKRLSGSIMANQEQERALIARELHDELGQSLTALHMDCKWMCGRIEEKDPQAAARALGMCGLIDKTIEEVRGIAVRLRPGVLDRLGLVDALEWYTGDFEKRTGITCIFERDGISRMNNTVSTAAYRIAQEAMTNVARHSRASCVNVVLQERDGVLKLSIVDNGRGFNPAALDEIEGLGVLGMRERASLVGGDLVLESAAGRGTRVHLEVPVHD